MNCCVSVIVLYAAMLFVGFRPLSDDDVTTGNKLVYRAPGVNVYSCSVHLVHYIH